MKGGTTQPRAHVKEHHNIRSQWSYAFDPPIYSAVPQYHHVRLSRVKGFQDAVAIEEIARMYRFLHDKVVLFGVEQVFATEGDLINHLGAIGLHATHVAPPIAKRIVSVGSILGY